MPEDFPGKDGKERGLVEQEQHSVLKGADQWNYTPGKSTPWCLGHCWIGQSVKLIQQFPPAGKPGAFPEFSAALEFLWHPLGFTAILHKDVLVLVLLSLLLLALLRGLSRP